MVGGENFLITLIIGVLGYVSQINTRESTYIFCTIKLSSGE